MWVGVARIVLDFYNNEKVALKHRNLEELCHDLRKLYNLSALEVADFDDPERCVLGFAVVMPAHWQTHRARAFVEKICKTIDETAFARVMIEDWDLIRHGEDPDPVEEI